MNRKPGKCNTGSATIPSLPSGASTTSTSASNSVPRGPYAPVSGYIPHGGNLRYDVFMINTGLVREDAPGSLRRGLVPALLVVALFLCHGVLGGLHQVCGPAASEQAHQAAVSGGAAALQGHSQEHSQDHGAAHPISSSDYAAALFVFLLLGTIVALLLGGAPLRGSTARLVTIGRIPTPLLLPPPRGPTAPLLQVFRL